MGKVGPAWIKAERSVDHLSTIEVAVVATDQTLAFDLYLLLCSRPRAIPQAAVFSCAGFSQATAKVRMLRAEPMEPRFSSPIGSPFGMLQLPIVGTFFKSAPGTLRVKGHPDILHVRHKEARKGKR